RKMADLEDVTLDGRPLQSLRVADLKAALEERGLSKSGQKNALVKRLKGALMLENLQRTSTANIGLQPNSQIGEEMSQNSFIKQYLAKQQELLRQRLEREAREAYDTNVNKEEGNRNQEAEMPGPPASGSMAVGVPDGEHRPEKGSASKEAPKRHSEEKPQRAGQSAHNQRAVRSPLSVRKATATEERHSEIERERALELERQRKLEQERAMEEERERADVLEREERQRALDQERMERQQALEREEREKALQRERELTLERERQDRLERGKRGSEPWLEAERKEKERIEREKALEQERLEREQEKLKQERALEQQRLELEPRELGWLRGKVTSLRPSAAVTSVSPPCPLLSPFLLYQVESPQQRGESRKMIMLQSPGLKQTNTAPPRHQRLRCLNPPLGSSGSQGTARFRRPRNFSDTPQPQASPGSSLTDSAKSHEEGLQSSTEQEGPEKVTKQEVTGHVGGTPEEETTLAPVSEKDGAKGSVSEDKEKEYTRKVDESHATNPLDSAQRRGRDAKKEEKQARQRSTSNDSSSSESDSGSSSSGSSGSSSSSQEKTISTTRGRRETHTASPCKRDPPVEKSKAAADGETTQLLPHKLYYFTFSALFESSENNHGRANQRGVTKKEDKQGRRNGQKKCLLRTATPPESTYKQVKETAMAEAEKLPETNEEYSLIYLDKSQYMNPELATDKPPKPTCREIWTNARTPEDDSISRAFQSLIQTPKAFSARKISISSSKMSPGTGSAEVEQDAGAAAGRKRRWGSSTAVTAKKPSISITTDSLKSLIPDIRQSLGQEAVVDLDPEQAVLSGPEDEEKERADQDLQIQRTVTQVVHLESQENGEKETKKSRHEDSEEEDPQGDGERTGAPSDKMDTSFPGAMETQSPSHTSHDVESNTVTPSDTFIRRSISQQKTGVSITIDDPVRSARKPSPPRGKVSNIVHISNLVRPFTLGQLKELLSRTGTLLEEGFWIDKIKSHCFVTYCSPEEAVATRASLHGVKWPQSNPKVLRVDFCQKDELDFHKGLADRPAAEDQGPGAARGRPPGLPSLLPERDQWAEREREMERREKGRAEREWDRDKVREFGKPGEEKEGGPPRSHSRERRRKERGKSKEKKTEKKEKPAEDPPAKLLDDLFRKTKAAPCIYWLPLTDEEFVQREAARADRKRENDKRRDGYRRPEGRGEDGGRRSRSRSDPRERRR
uniref:Apoptotic chromatin condensation inducer 1a n=1 Tax=Gasterosteus aculeatus TaxID=69293 RepID=G3PLU1_GASAC